MKRSSLYGSLKRLPHAQFSDVVYCLISCAGLQVVVNEPSHEVVKKGLAYVTLLPQDEDETCQGHATFVEVSEDSSEWNASCGSAHKHCEDVVYCFKPVGPF